ncbi:uncharacterized protein LOC136035404 isoform X2 [Artemia franciscana]|uniref:uncharacterized protein LOC136035404 isoform X2 n=1 Tax=Artemia franciscana TaxID=6661 RepID=UPI0032DBA2BE
MSEAITKPRDTKTTLSEQAKEGETNPGILTRALHGITNKLGLTHEETATPAAATEGLSSGPDIEHEQAMISRRLREQELRDVEPTSAEGKMLMAGTAETESDVRLEGKQREPSTGKVEMYAPGPLNKVKGIAQDIKGHLSEHADFAKEATKENYRELRDERERKAVGESDASVIAKEHLVDMPKAAAKGIGETVKADADVVAGMASTGYEKLKSAFGIASNKTKDAAENVAESARATKDYTVDSAKSAYDKTVDSTKSAYDKTTDSAKSVYDSTADTAKSAYNKATETLGSAYDKTKDTAQSTYDQVTGTAHSAYDKTAEATKSAYDKTADAAHSVYNKTGDAGKQAYDSTKEAAKSTGKSISDAAYFTGKGAERQGDQVKSELPSYSPSSSGEKLAQHLVKSEKEGKKLTEEALKDRDLSQVPGFRSVKKAHEPDAKEDISTVDFASASPSQRKVADKEGVWSSPVDRQESGFFSDLAGKIGDMLGGGKINAIQTPEEMDHERLIHKSSQSQVAGNVPGRAKTAWTPEDRIILHQERFPKENPE